jgi:hypothetical protein
MAINSDLFEKSKDVEPGSAFSLEKPRVGGHMLRSGVA